MSNPLTLRQSAAAIEQIGEEMAALCIRLDGVCNRAPAVITDMVNAIPHQEYAETIAETLRTIGDLMCHECDAAEDADTLRRANPLEPDYRRLG